MIRVRGFHKQYGDQAILTQIDLGVPEGRTLVVVGGSGCGKSTLLRHVAGIESRETGALSGVIGVGEIENILAVPERELQKRRIRGPIIGLLFQEGALFDTHDVRENLSWALRENTNMTADEIAARVASVLRMVEMDQVPGVLDKSPDELSGGQRRRVALARALALEPRVMLYDEPTAGLDPPVALEISQLIRRLQTERGLTAIVATHDMQCASVTADQLAMMQHGRIVFLGTLEEAADDPSVKEFMQGGMAHDTPQPV